MDLKAIKSNRGIEIDFASNLELITKDIKKHQKKIKKASKKGDLTSEMINLFTGKISKEMREESAIMSNNIHELASQNKIGIGKAIGKILPDLVGIEKDPILNGHEMFDAKAFEIIKEELLRLGENYKGELTPQMKEKLKTLPGVIEGKYDWNDSRAIEEMKARLQRDGIMTNAGRYPMIMEDSEKITRVFLSDDVEGNRARVSVVTALSMNADNDGDSASFSVLKLKNGRDYFQYKIDQEMQVTDESDAFFKEMEARMAYNAISINHRSVENAIARTMWYESLAEAQSKARNGSIGPINVSLQGIRAGADALYLNNNDKNAFIKHSVVGQVAYELEQEVISAKHGSVVTNITKARDLRRLTDNYIKESTDENKQLLLDFFDGTGESKAKNLDDKTINKMWNKLESRGIVTTSDLGIDIEEVDKDYILKTKRALHQQILLKMLWKE